uniref:DUF4220 domain-containing protein n=1 Tax=Leersia perrieri TaxID=77586 RepID=A0A0D9V0K1_9ORYZ
MSSSDDVCNPDVLDISSEHLRSRILITDAVLGISLIIVAILVGAGFFSRRYRRHGSIRLLSLGAYTLFLPLVSYVVSGVDKENCALPDGIECTDDATMYLLVWASLVQIIGVNYCTAIAAHDDERRNIGPTVQLLVGAIWTLFLVIKHFKVWWYDYTGYLAIWMPFALNLAKILVKLYAYEMAWCSFELGGRNPRLITGYMAQLNLLQGIDVHDIPLVLMGEDKQKVEKGPHGYRFTCDSVDSSTFVTIDKVTNMVSTGDTVFKSCPQLDDLCLSFSLFKLLRQRFTRCPVAEADYYRTVPNFMVKLRRADPQNILNMIANELSFASDFYYSYLPISHSSWWLPILNVVLSFFVIAYCLGGGIFLLVAYSSPGEPQMTCNLACDHKYEYIFGSIWIVEVLTLCLGIPVALSEAWEIISYACSNWTKVNLICYYVKKTSWQRSPLMQRIICRIVRFRCKLLNNNYKMGQASIMDTNMKIVKLVRRLLQLPDQKMEYVEIKRQVSSAIHDKFRASNWSLPTVTATLQQSPIGNNVLWACNGKGTADIILVWHIATCVFEIKHPYEPTNAPAVAASQLSRYCAYLLSSAPELLPDDKEWSKKLYKSVKKIAEPIFSSISNKRHMQYDRILQQLDEKCSSNTELKNGVALGKLLVNETQGSEQEGWEILAEFWSAMLLYIAPSDNAGAHREAIARGEWVQIGKGSNGRPFDQTKTGISMGDGNDSTALDVDGAARGFCLLPAWPSLAHHLMSSASHQAPGVDHGSPTSGSWRSTD